jgi:hypothetical protein
MANSNALAGDMVYLRGGTYTVSGNAFQPTHSGTSIMAMISFSAYTGETPTIIGATNPFYFDAISYVSIKGITFSNLGSFGRIANGANHNEIANCTFIDTVGSSGHMLISGKTSALNSSPWVTHNWIHGNHFAVSGQADGNGGLGCTDGGGDTLNIGNPQGSYGGGTVENDNYNTIENNFFEHAPHANIDGYGMYTVIRNNVFHNEPWSAGCTVTNNYYPTYANSAYNGKYAHRNFQYTEDYGRTAVYALIEGNRIGYGSANQANDGAENFDLAAPQNIVRYNFIYDSMNSGLQFKYGWGNPPNGGGNGGTYNRVYNNTLYNNGVGYPWGMTYGEGNCATSACPFAATAISLYQGSSSGIGNVLKNNLIYAPQSLGFVKWGGDVMMKNIGSNGGPPYYPATGWTSLTAAQNWCTAKQTLGSSNGNGGCSAYGDPKFTNPDTSNVNSKTLPDLSLQASSTAIDGGTWLTTATNSGSNSTSLTVADALYFQDGTWGSDLARASAGLGGTMQADWLAMGTVSNTVQIGSITYGPYNNPAGTITLASPMTWSNGAPIWLYKKSDGAIVLVGAAPDYGASEHSGTTVAPPTNLQALPQ